MTSLLDIQRPVTVCKASAGTGKTYTLAAYYVGLILSGEDYRSILAITFTNKATAEMSERILGFLHDIAQGGADDFLNYARSFMLRDANADEALLRRRAGECFRRMLLDYDHVQVQTIDSFLQTLLGGLAGILHIGAGLSTELDIDHVIRTAVDQLLTTDLTEADRVILEDYMQLKLDQESHWDVRESLIMLAKELYNESVQMLDADDKIIFDAEAIARRRERIEAQWENDERVKDLARILNTCDSTDYNRYTKAAYERLKRSVEDPEDISAKDRFRGVSDKYCNAEPMREATALAAELAKTYNTLFLTIRFSREMELMASLQTLIQRNLTEANSALLARTASTLCKALRTGDADFILEKAGIRYKHVLMDEFQDTSKLQWSVIEQLLRDVLAGAGNTLLIVGDIKQSIYRWRNGDWHIMDGLTSEGVNELTNERINEKFTSLTRNFRSSEEVVRFNLTLFDDIIRHNGGELTQRIYSEGFSPDQIDTFYQSNKKKGGYVHFQAIPNATKEDLAIHMFEQIGQLLDQGVAPSDIMILVREKKEANLICSMTDLPIVSADSFMLESSNDVQLIIAALRCCLRDEVVSQRLVEQVRPGYIEQIRAAVGTDTPLYEAMCELVRLLLTDAEGHYTGTETAYLNALLDRTREYVGAYGSDINRFLEYWDDTMHTKPIPVTSSNAIRIMTVHASKGLQAQTLFVPFCMWEKEDGRHKPKVWCQVSERVDSNGDYVPVPFGAEMAESDYQAAYTEEQINMRIDNLNMLYVALTRAEDNLFVSTAYSVNKDGKRGACNHVGTYLMDCYGEEYEAGDIKVRGERLEVRGEMGVQTAELWANSDQVRFVQSQEGALYTENGEEAYRRMARMEEGTICHEIFAHIRKADELDAVLDDFETRGEIKDPAQRESLKSLISSAWEGSPEMRDWFTAPWELRLEEAIYIDQKELRPDRVMINPETKEAIVLDYKFGQWNEHYKAQVREYMEALRRMGHAPVRGYLWFAQRNQLVPVTHNP